MKTILLMIALFAIINFSFAQEQTLWKATVKNIKTVSKNKLTLNSLRLYELNIAQLKKILGNTTKRGHASKKLNTIVPFPNTDGGFDNFQIYEMSNMDPILAAKYPEIKSYVGQGIVNKSSTIYFSLSPLGLQTMTINADKSAVFIEPYTTDLMVYSVYKKTDKSASLNKFECKVIQSAKVDLENTSMARPNADDGIMRNFRLAMSVTGEYTAYFGGTKALALAALNNTMTRINAVFENDCGIHMNLIADTDLIIYTNAATDPYSNASKGIGGAWNTELQNTLTTVLGNTAYDIGHLLGASGGGGNAGCIGCVCIDDTSSIIDLNKGSGFTSPNDGIPAGDNFDIDYVAHEMGHQFGANHTFTHSYEGTGVQVEPGSGSTIMGYAGITSNDVQSHSDPFFHAISIQQITNTIKTKTCQTNVFTGNAVPIVNAGLDYTIPKETPFMLIGTGTDSNGDVLTYNWEQMDLQTTTMLPSATKTAGVNFRSYSPSTSPIRYFPKMSSILTGATFTEGSELIVEVLPSVARILNFRFTVRDNHIGGPANNSDDVILKVNPDAGPFTISSPNTAVSYVGGSTQTVTWNVAGTTANGVNCANIDILLSTNEGATWTTILAKTPNDGSEVVTIPNVIGTKNRIMVKGTDHIFFDISNTNFTITMGSIDMIAPIPPILTVSETKQTTISLSWSGATDNVGVTGYNVYQGATLLGSTSSTTYLVTGLTAATAYVFSVRAKDAAGNVSPVSNVVNVTTLLATLDYCISKSNDASDEQIYKVVLGTINNTTEGTSGYENFTNLYFTNLGRGTINTITITPTWTSAIYNEGYAVWIDYNMDGDFDDMNELVWSKEASKIAPVSGVFTIPALATLGARRMRVAMKYNGIPNFCEVFNYGQVEDYTVIIVEKVVDTIAPTTPTMLVASGTTDTATNLSWIPSADNIAVTGYDVYQGDILKATVTTTTYAVTGLIANKAYSFSVKAKDAAGNISSASNILNINTLPVSLTYCTLKANSSADEKIGKVVFGTINNTNIGVAGYQDFTALSTTVAKKTTCTIIIMPLWTSAIYNEGYAVWIDYNMDGDFDDRDELVWSKTASKIAPVSGTFTIPETAQLGVTRMRVAMKYNGIPNACEVFSYGQVHDYSLKIITNEKYQPEIYSKGVEDIVPTIQLYPNPTTSILNVSSVPENTAFILYDIMGQRIMKGNLFNGTIDTSTLNSGNYILELIDSKTILRKYFIKQ